MKIAYFSPFSPDPSGISDFSEELVLELKKHMDIELFARKPVSNKDIKDNFVIHMANEIDNEELREQFDFLVYQSGNNRKYHKDVIDSFLKYPDILEIHDLSLHYYLAEDTFVQNDFEKYIQIMKYCHGQEGEDVARKFLQGQIRAPWETSSSKFSVNKHLIDKARAVIVHSDMAKQYVKGIRLDVPVINIPLHTPDIVDDYKEYKDRCKKQLNIEEDILVLGSFGYATTAKRIEQILTALSRFKKENNCRFLYCIVGKVENIDIDKLLKNLDLKENVIVTGFTEIEEFKQYMGACDICLNLRYPTQGESSASLHRMLGMGKPILVTNVGSFEEYPDDIVIKIRHDANEIQDICDAISQLISDPQELESRSRGAYEYANERCRIEKNAERYFEFLSKLSNNKFYDDYEDVYLDRLQTCNLLDDSYIEETIKYLECISGLNE